MGMKVQQSYYRLALTRVKTLYGETHLMDEQEAQGLEIKDQTLAAAPNVIHSLDACHLAMTVRAAHAEGIDAFALIHDSYGTHACNVDTLGRVLREQFVELYSGDWLAEFERQVREYAPDVALPERPEQGSLDVTRVLASPYFFS
jgi:DNA-directed RNA polymerase